MQRGRHALYRSRWALGVAAVAAAALAVAGCSSGSSATSAATGASGTSGASAGASSSPSAAASFYNGKTLTFIIPSKPGGTFDAWGRLLSIYMGQYLHATVKATNLGAGNTITGQNALASSPANGLVLGMINLGGDVELKATNTKGLTFDPTKDVEIVGAVPPGLTTMFTQASSPYKSISDLQHAGTQLKAVIQSTGSTTLSIRTILGVYGVNAKFIAGYTATSDQVAGFLRGDGELTMTPDAALLDALKDGKARPILTTALPPKDSSIYPQMKDVPLLSEVITQDPPTAASGVKTLNALLAVTHDGQIIAVPKGVPADQVAELTAALQWTMQQPALIASALKEGLNTGPAIDPETVKADMDTAFANASTLAPYASAG